MAGTREGGLRAAATNKERHGEKFYAVIGQRGGEKGTTGGFYLKAPCTCDVIKGEHTKPRCAGTKGGLRSRRTKTTKTTVEVFKSKRFWDIKI